MNINVFEDADNTLSTVECTFCSARFFIDVSIVPRFQRHFRKHLRWFSSSRYNNGKNLQLFNCHKVEWGKDELVYLLDRAKMNLCIRQFIRAAACEYVFKMIQDYSHCASCFISGSEHYIHCGSKRLVEANFIYNQLYYICSEKTKIKKKEAVNDPFKNLHLLKCSQFQP